MRRLTELLPLRDAGVSEEELAMAERRLGTDCPRIFAVFCGSAMCSQWADFPQCGCRVLSLSELMSMWELHEEHRSGPARLIDIASDGSRERFCLDPAFGHIVMLDITWEGGEPPICAQTLTELVTKLADGWNPFEPQT
jgi:hypothetical protein